MADPPARYDKARRFLRAVESQTYSLTEQRRQRLDSINRVIRKPYPAFDEGGKVKEKGILDPADEPFLTQSLHAHYVALPPGARDKGHGHQNEAFFYILEGRGFEMHDGVRYDWDTGDGVVVHNDSVHWHNNLDPDKPAVALIMKPKPLWIYLGLHQQGPIGNAPSPDDDRWEPPRESVVHRAPQDLGLKKVIKPGDTPWEMTPHGKVRWLANASLPVRVKGIDVHLQEIPGGSRSGKQWQMGDEIFYVLEGRGYDLHWDVEVEITDRYYWRVAKKPTRWEWQKGDMVYIPQNSLHQHFNADPSNPVKLISGMNRIFKLIGYSEAEQLENAPEYDTQREPAGAGV